MTEHYTDDDVTAAAEAFALAPLGDDREVARRLLDAVAPQIAARARVAIAARTAEAVASHVEHLKLGVPDDSPTGDAECRAYDHAAAYIREHLARAEQVNP